MSGSGSLRCLWVAKDLPFPLDTGAKVYSSRVAESLALRGAFIRYLGFGLMESIPGDSRIDWVAVSGRRRSRRRALFSSLPLAAAVDATPEYAGLVQQQLREHWDVLAIDGYGSGWVLDAALAHRRFASRPLLIHVSQNHEAAVWRSMARGAGASLLERVVFYQNYLKARALERRILRHAELLTTITPEDANSMGRDRPSGSTLTLTPGHTGWKAPPRCIDAHTPRRVIIVGSFRWAIKQENLRQFLQIAAPQFTTHDIGIDIVGDMPVELRAMLQKLCPTACFHGFVPDLAPLFAQARMAIVPEIIGGGFKIKLLDYIFARVPVASLAQAVAGLPEPVRQTMLLHAELPALVGAVVGGLDRLDELNRMQEKAFSAAASLYDWDDRGRELERAIIRLYATGRSGDEAVGHHLRA